jgi:hypothetical protein
MARHVNSHSTIKIKIKRGLAFILGCLNALYTALSFYNEFIVHSPTSSFLFFQFHPCT